MKTLVILAALVAGGLPWAKKKGDIVPVPTHDVKVETENKHKVAICDMDAGVLKVRLSTSAGYLFLDISVRNKADHTIRLKPDDLQLLNDGGPVEPLDGEQYIREVYTTPPYPIDADGKIRADKEKGKVMPYTPGDTGQGGLAERMAATDMEQHSSSERMKITKELLSLKNDPLANPSDLEAGKTAKARRIYQRNGLELPLMVKFKNELGRVTIKFERER
jgi:hypothetical protein